MELRKPLFLHCRDAADRLISILQEQTLTAPAVAHCFTGNKGELEKYIDMGFYIGITGWVRNLPIQASLLRIIAPVLPVNI